MIEGPFSTEHEYLWREFESAIHEGRKPKWEGAQKPLKMQPNNEQNTRMEISTIKFEPPWKEQMQHMLMKWRNKPEGTWNPDWQVHWVQALAPRNSKWQHWLHTCEPTLDLNHELVVMWVNSTTLERG
jgi:hypothetical protein